MIGRFLRRKKGAPHSRAPTPTILQMEVTECGAASLAMILAHFGRWVPLEELRAECGVSRDGSKAVNILRAARRYGLESTGYKIELEHLSTVKPPCIIFWNFNHFVVLEGYSAKGAWINDPAGGRRRISPEEFDQSFTGVVLSFQPSASFKRGGVRPNAVSAIRRRLGEARVAVLFVTLAGTGLVLPGMAIPSLQRIFIDQVVIQRLDNWLMPIVSGLFVLGCIQALLVFLQHHYLARLRIGLGLTSAVRFVWHVLRLPIGYFAQRYSIEIVNRTPLNSRLAEIIAGDLTTNLVNGLAAAVYVAIMVQYDRTLTEIGLIFSIVNIVSLWFASQSISGLSQRLQLDQGKLAAVTFRCFSMLDTLKSTGGESNFLTMWTGHHAKVINSEQILGRLRLTLVGLPIFLSSVSTITIIVVGGSRVMDGALSIGMLLAFQTLNAAFAAPVQGLMQLGTQFQEAQAAVGRLDDVLRQDFAPEFANESNDSSSKLQLRLGGRLSVEKVCFGFSPLDPPFIRDFSISVPPGSRVALVGGSGSGKSTIGKMIAGLLLPSSGEILLDEIPLSAVTRNELRSTVGYVYQSTALFPTSVRSNICLWDTTIPEERIVAAAHDALIHDVISRRPNGYDHIVDENGRNFSGGQRQRIALARALALEPSILVLDEATSALDAATEAAFMQNLRRRGCAAILIAHRLSTIRDCDEIIVLERGTIVERGKHDDLIRQDGRYRALLSH